MGRLELAIVLFLVVCSLAYLYVCQCTQYRTAARHLNQIFVPYICIQVQYNYTVYRTEDYYTYKVRQDCLYRNCTVYSYVSTVQVLVRVQEDRKSYIQCRYSYYCGTSTDTRNRTVQS